MMWSTSVCTHGSLIIVLSPCFILFIFKFVKTVIFTILHATSQVAVSLLTVHMIGKLATGDSGSLSVSLLEKVRLMSKKV